MRALLARPGQAVARERLFDAVFAGESEVQPQALEVVAYRLRRKLAATRARLVTLRGLGYLLAPNERRAAGPDDAGRGRAGVPPDSRLARRRAGRLAPPPPPPRRRAARPRCARACSPPSCCRCWR